MRYASIRKMDISNGSGIGVSLFVQGCPFHCKGCFNQETWDFDGGKEWTEEIENQFMTLVAQPFVKRVSILGGEPLCQENVNDVVELLQRIKIFNPNVTTWVFTGYGLQAAMQILGDQSVLVDYLKTGVYRREEETDDNLQYGVRLSTRNQMITKLNGEK